MKVRDSNQSKPRQYGRRRVRWYCQELVKMKGEWRSKWTIGRDCPNWGIWEGVKRSRVTWCIGGKMGSEVYRWRLDWERQWKCLSVSLLFPVFRYKGINRSKILLLFLERKIRLFLWEINWLWSAKGRFRRAKCDEWEKMSEEGPYYRKAGGPC